MTASVTEPTAQPLPFVRRANLVGAASGLDRRINPFRPDLAHADLSDRVGAQHYVIPERRRVRASVAGIRAAPDAQSENISQILYGEHFDVLEAGADWCWGQCVQDGYVGYVARTAFADSLSDATHKMIAPHAHVFASPSIKAPVLHSLYRGALMHITSIEGKFAALDTGGFVRTVVLAPLDVFASDWVQAAEEFLGTAYLWGGRTRDGIDCSGLVQSALYACGINCPRDSDMQARDIGTALPESDWQALQRGDFVFFPGHVGIMHCSKNLLHANAHHMKTVIEPLADVIARLKPEYEKPVISIRRIVRDTK